MAYWRQGYRDWDDPWYDDSEEEEEDITFYRPDGKTERKSIEWCRSNGFFEIEEGLWSGDWYWERFPEKKRELEQKKRKRQEDLKDPKYWEKWHAKQRADRRAKLLDEVYGSEYSNARALAELRRMGEEEYEFECPIVWCKSRFPTNDDMQEHVREQCGKGHHKYRVEHGIPFEGIDPLEKKKLEQQLQELERE